MKFFRSKKLLPMIDNIIELRIKVYYEKKRENHSKFFFFFTRSRIDTRLTCRDIERERGRSCRRPIKT